MELKNKEKKYIILIAISMVVMFYATRLVPRLELQYAFGYTLIPSLYETIGWIIYYLKLIFNYIFWISIIMLTISRIKNLWSDPK